MINNLYSMSEVGLLPVDWELKPFPDCFSFIRNNTYARERLTDSIGSVANIHYGDVLIKYGAVLNFARDSVPYLKSGVKPNRDMLKNGDLVFADTAEDDTVGKAVEVQEVESRMVVAGLHTVACRPREGLFAPRYLGYYINSLAYHNQLLSLITGTKVSSVSRAGFLSTYVILPPLHEQKAIADALSDVDELLAAMTTLIEKKRAIKQGAMQELLGMRNEGRGIGNEELGMRNCVPRRRLPGFSGEWVEKRLGDCVTIARGGSPRPIDAYLTSREDGLNWVKIGDVAVGAKYIERTSEKILPSGLSSTRMVYPGDFLLSNSMSFGRPYIMKIEGCIHDGWLVIQDYKDAFDTEYLYYVLGSESVTTQYQTIAAGSSVLNLNKDVIASVIVAVPPTLAEQRAIAEVLSDMDAEIEALEAKRAKYESIKQGMMQELLTGKTRLKGV
jgi:type I restriction enzyme S subunit